MIEFGDKDLNSTIISMFRVLKDLKKNKKLIRRKIKDIKKSQIPEMKILLVKLIVYCRKTGPWI